MEKPKILIVEDDPVSSSVLEDLLLSEPYDLYFAADGIDAVSLALSVRPDVILMDVMMPKMNGFEACKSIRGLPEIAEIPIIFVTALDDQQSRLQGLQAGADDFIAKPYNRAELFARLQTILRLNRYRLLAEQQKKLQKLNDDLLAAYDKTIQGWLQALDLRDRETEGHTERVTRLTVEFARRAGVSEADVEHVRRGALLHDVGKLGVPDAILHKPGALTPEEWEVMRRHPEYAMQWLSHIEFLKPAMKIPYCHHEKWDGTGYPRGLKGEEIPLEARLFALADVWDALRSDRPYRKALTYEQAWSYIEEQSGAHFDPALVPLFLDIVRKNRGETD